MTNEQAQEIMDVACKKICNTGYLGFYVLGKVGTSDLIYGDNNFGKNTLAHLIASVISYVAPQMDISSELLFAEIAKKFDKFETDKKQGVIPTYTKEIRRGGD